MLGVILTALLQHGAPAEPMPVTVKAAYTSDILLVRGGRSRSGIAHLGNLDVTLTVESAALSHRWRGGRLFVYGLMNHGGSASALAGDAQGVSNIEAPSAARLYEAWIQQSLAGGRLSVLAGRYDLNSEFDHSRTASLFVHSSHGIGAELAASGHNGPSIFPVTSLALRVRARVAPRVFAQAAVLDGTPGNPPSSAGTAGSREGLLFASEVVLLTRAATDRTAGPERERTTRRRIGRQAALPYEHKVALGAWRYTSPFPHVFERDALGNPATRRGSQGVYLLAEQRVRTVGAFARVGAADSRVNRFALYTGAGMVCGRCVSVRPDDQVGLAIAAAHNGDAYRRARSRDGAPVSRSEVVLELTYRAALMTWLVVQPDAQLVVSPDTDRSRPNVLVFGLRGEVSF